MTFIDSSPHLTHRKYITGMHQREFENPGNDQFSHQTFHRFQFFSWNWVRLCTELQDITIKTQFPLQFIFHADSARMSNSMISLAKFQDSSQIPGGTPGGE